MKAPVLGADGSVRLLLHQVTDVTDEVRGRQTLAKAERRAGRILERKADAYGVPDCDLSVLSLNVAAENLAGRSRGKMLGRPHAEAFPDPYRVVTEAVYKRVVNRGSQRHLEWRLALLGRDVALEINVYATDEGGVAISARDISERVRNVEILRQSELQRFLTQLSDAPHACSDADALLRTAVRLLAVRLGMERAFSVECLDPGPRSVG